MPRDLFYVSRTKWHPPQLWRVIGIQSRILWRSKRYWNSLTQNVELIRRFPSNGILCSKHSRKKKFQVLLHGDMSTKLSKGIYKNISKFGLHREAVKTPVLPCLDVIEWMTRRIDHESRALLNIKDKHVANYQDPVLNQLYHLKEAQVKLTPEWLKNKTEFVDFLSIMKGWWSEVKFIAKPSPVEWITSKFRKSI